jgi:type IV pilus assembly protein PilV
MMRALMARTRRGRGFTLIEVMVALVVLSIGLLGIGKLVLFSARANDSAYLRGQATAMAYEILDNMRSNRVTAIQGGYTTALATMPPNPGSCIEIVCTAATLANYDLYQWKTRLAAALPSGQGSVVTAGSPTTATITVQWDDAVAQSTFDPAGAPVGVAQPMTVVLETVL